MAIHGKVTCILVATCKEIHHMVATCKEIHHMVATCKEIHHMVATCKEIHHMVATCKEIHHMVATCKEIHHMVATCREIHLKVATCREIHLKVATCREIHNMVATCREIHHMVARCREIHLKVATCKEIPPMVVPNLDQVMDMVTQLTKITVLMDIIKVNLQQEITVGVSPEVRLYFFLSMYANWLLHEFTKFKYSNLQMTYFKQDIRNTGENQVGLFKPDLRTGKGSNILDLA